MVKCLPFRTGKALAAIAIALCSLTAAMAQQPISSTGPAKSATQLLSSGTKIIGIRFVPGNVTRRAVSTAAGEQWIIGVDDGSPILKAGAPDLPKLTSSIIIPDHANTSITVVSSSYIDYHNIEIAPSKGNLSRLIDPSKVAFAKGEEYRRNAFYPSSEAELGDPYVLRDYRGQSVIVHPVRYNPITKTLRVYSEIVVKVVVEDENAAGFRRAKPVTSIDREFDGVYSRHFINYRDNARYTPLGEYGKMLVICPSQFRATIEPWVKWKKLKGIPVEVVDIATVGNSESSIKSYVQNYYNTNGLSFLVLIGDASHITPYAAPVGPSDNSYAYISGNDSYPEFLVGRFSGESVADISTIVDRTIRYEKSPSTSATWYRNAAGIASMEGPGDDNQLDFEHMREIRSKLLTYNYTNVHELYEGSQGGTDAAGHPLAADVAAVVNSGVGMINYCGHGSQYDWVTSGFSTANIAALQNTSAWPFVVSVGCVNGDFVTTTCFAEAWTRARNSSGQPTGAVAAFMSTINQTWNPPMDAQDEMNDILIESVSGNIKRTVGGIAINGCLKMNDSYGTAGADMTDTWVMFGDPSVMIHTNTASVMTPAHNGTTILGTTSFDVTCNVEDAFVSLVQNGEIIGTGVVNGGIATINFPALSVPDTMFVTVSAYNHVPYLGHVLVIPPSGPYVVKSQHTIADAAGNNNGIADYAETVSLNVSLQNIGPAMANNVTAVLSTTSPHITITDNTESFGSINAAATALQNGGYTFTTSSNVPDGHNAMFSLAITDTDGHTWSNNFAVTINAPALATAQHILVSDPLPGGNNNGVLDPGETAVITIETTNSGSSNSPAATGTLTTTVPSNVTITTGTYTIGSIAAGTSANPAFNVTVASSVPVGSAITLYYDVTAGGYDAQRTYSTVVSLASETFETNSFESYPWVQAGHNEWFTTGEAPYEGAYCSRSGDIENDQYSALMMTVNVSMNDSVKFYHKVSSEEDWDFLKFYIDGVETGKWSGATGWAKAAYALAPGSYELKWSYEKDGVISDNLDCAWIDGITFPAGSLVLAVEESGTAAASEMKSYPNPFADEITIAYSIEASTDVRLTVLNALGQEIEILESGEKATGTYSYKFNSSSLPSGVYYCKLQAGRHATVQKIVLAR